MVVVRVQMECYPLSTCCTCHCPHSTSFRSGTGSNGMKSTNLLCVNSTNVRLAKLVIIYRLLLSWAMNASVPKKIKSGSQVQTVNQKSPSHTHTPEKKKKKGQITYSRAAHDSFSKWNGTGSFQKNIKLRCSNIT